MKKVGIVGGIGPESTLDYYRGIIEAFRGKSGGSVYPEIVIYSASLATLVEIVEGGRLDELAVWLVEKIEALHRAGADFAVIGSNTPHVVFEEVRARAPIPLLSIVEETCRKARELGLKRVGLMGTRFTMRSDFFQQSFRRSGMSVIVPAEEERQYIHQKLFSEIELGIIKDSTREGLLSIVKGMIERDGIDSLILGCTELPLIMDRSEYGIPFLNTTAIHIESIVRCLEDSHL